MASGSTLRLVVVAALAAAVAAAARAGPPAAGAGLAGGDGEAASDRDVDRELADLLSARDVPLVDALLDPVEGARLEALLARRLDPPGELTDVPTPMPTPVPSPLPTLVTEGGNPLFGGDAKGSSSSSSGSSLSLGGIVAVVVAVVAATACVLSGACAKRRRDREDRLSRLPPDLTSDFSDTRYSDDPEPPPAPKGLSSPIRPARAGGNDVELTKLV